MKLKDSQKYNLFSKFEILKSFTDNDFKSFVFSKKLDAALELHITYRKRSLFKQKINDKIMLKNISNIIMMFE